MFHSHKRISRAPSSPDRGVEHQHQQEIDAGLLNSRQSLQTLWPTLSREETNRLPETMERLHFEAVERSVLGLIRCRRGGGAIDCRLLGVWSALSFVEIETVREKGRCLRRWRVGPGLLSRSGYADYGTLTLGADREGVGRSDSLSLVLPDCLKDRRQEDGSRVLKDGGQDGVSGRGGERWLLWSQVEGYPSRFLRAETSAAGWIGRVYAGFHRQVTFGYLRRLARLLKQGGTL